MSATEATPMSGWWRVRNSAWILVPLLSIGLLTWAAFLFVGIRAKNRLWLIFAALWFVVMIGYYVGTDLVETMPVSPLQGSLDEFLNAIPLLQWLGGVAHVAWTNGSWLRWKAHHVRAVPRRSRRAAGVAPSPFVPPQQAAPAARADATLRGTAPAAASPSVPTAPAAALDLNHATAAQLQAALGMDQAWGEWLVATRTRLGRFSSVDQLLTEAKVPPHFYLPAKNRLMVSPPVRVPRARGLGRLDY